MMLSILILSLFAYIINVCDHLSKERIDVNLLIAAIVIISSWDICFALSIIMIILTILIGILGAKFNN